MEEDIHLQSRSRIRDYEPVVGRSIIEELRLLAEELSGKIVQNVNSTYIGGGVAEILEHMVPLLNQLGVDTRWEIIQGNEEFFEVTKKFHNALHGNDVKISDSDYDKLWQIFTTSVLTANTVILSDYEKGSLPLPFINKCIEYCRAKQLPVFVDPKTDDWSKYRGATCVTPNEKETYMLQRRCLRVARDVKAGETFTAEMVEPLRPAVPGALMAWDTDAVIGKKALVDMPYGKELRWANISD